MLGVRVHIALCIHGFHLYEGEVLAVGPKRSPVRGQTNLHGFAGATQSGFRNRIAAPKRHRLQHSRSIGHAEVRLELFRASGGLLTHCLAPRVDLDFESFALHTVAAACPPFRPMTFVIKMEWFLHRNFCKSLIEHKLASMKRFISASAVVVAIAFAILQIRALGQTATDPHRAMLTTYCVTCHNARLKTGGLALDGLDLDSCAE